MSTLHKDWGRIGEYAHIITLKSAKYTQRLENCAKKCNSL
jgi:hypothetical protein